MDSSGQDDPQGACTSVANAELPGFDVLGVAPAVGSTYPGPGTPTKVMGDPDIASMPDAVSCILVSSAVPQEFALLLVAADGAYYLEHGL